MTRRARGAPNPIRATAIEDRRAKILELATLNYSTRQIAARLGVPMLQVQRDAKIVRGRRILDAIVMDDSLAQRSISKYELVQQWAAESYHRSLQDQIDLEEELQQTKGKKDRMVLIKRKTRAQAGGNAFLTTIINAQSRIDEINGLIGRDKFEGEVAHQTPQFVRVVLESREQVGEYESLKLEQAKALGVIEGVATPSAGPRE